MDPEVCTGNHLTCLPLPGHRFEEKSHYMPSDRLMKVSIPELKTFIAAAHTGKSGSENFFHLQPPEFNNQMTVEQIQGFQNEEQEINIIPVAGKVIISYYYNQKNHHSGSHFSGKIKFP